MQMTNEEIVRDYKQASNKNKQVRILADLNQTSPSEILTILAKEGVEGVKMPEKIMPRKKPTEARLAASVKAPMEPRKDLPEVYAQIEAILTALPENATEHVRSAAASLTVALFSEYVDRRMGKGRGHGA